VCRIAAVPRTTPLQPYMSPESSRVVGEIAAAAGVIIFLVIFFCHAILISKLTKNMSSTQANRIIYLMVVGVLAVTIVGTALTQHSSKSSQCPSVMQEQGWPASVAIGCEMPQ